MENALMQMQPQLEEVARASLDHIRFFISMIEQTGLVSVDHYSQILDRDFFYEREHLQRAESLRDTPTVGVFMFNDVNPILMVILYGLLAPVWWTFAWMAVWYRPENGNRNFIWVDTVDTIWFWGNTITWGTVFVFFWLALFPSAVFRFAYWVVVLASALAGPFAGWWVCFVVYLYNYLKNNEAYTTANIFLHLFLLGVWFLIQIFFTIDSLGPIFDWYLIIAK